ncbi:DUF4227 family protein [Paenibacillus sepulcri]|uniref:YqzK family protein n=1 Tax=Paenibacillus sepulcri TaxID=359917 RepID=A0ABS7CBC1_9BACL|nr:YqzK family protein [Paenibacillus sepulcri]
MVVSLRRWVRRISFALLLAILTILMYGGCRFAAAWIVPSDPYRIPQGHALKVFQPYAVAEDTSLSERLRVFYWYGE